MNPIIFLRAAYWLGAVLDAWIGLQFVFPTRFGALLGMSEAPSNIETRFALWLGAGLTFGWTVLLIWGSLHPVENRFILILTVVPVMLGLVLTNLAGYLNGYVSQRSAISYWFIEGVVILVYISAYIVASRMSE